MWKPFLNEPTTTTVNENPFLPQPTPRVTPNIQAPLASTCIPRALHNSANYNTPGLLEQNLLQRKEGKH